MNFYNSVALKTRAAIEGILFTALASFLAYVVVFEAFTMNTTLGWVAFLSSVGLSFCLIVFGLRLQKPVLALPLISVGCVVSSGLLLALAMIEWMGMVVEPTLGIGAYLIIVSVALIFFINYYFKIHFHKGLQFKPVWHLAYGISLIILVSFYVFVIKNIFLVFPVGDARIFGWPGIIMVIILGFLFFDLWRYSRKQ